MMVSIGDGMIDLIHHVQPGSSNFLTKKALNYKVIVGIKGKGTPVEIKDLQKETLSKGKVPHLDKIFDMEENLQALSFCLLSNTVAKYRSYMFYPLEILDILEEIDHDDWSANLILK